MFHVLRSANGVKSRICCRSAAIGLMIFGLPKLGPIGVERAIAESVVAAMNRSEPARCAEVDNVNVPLFAPAGTKPIASYVIEARHPSYKFDKDITDPDFAYWVPPEQPDYKFEDPGRFIIFDNSSTAIIAIRQENWWRPNGMTAIGEMATVVDAHYIVVQKRIEGDQYPEVLVLYEDGNMRLKPLPRVDQLNDDLVFGSSVIVGPAPVSDRPFVDVSAVRYLPESDTLEIIYSSGESARLRFESVTREATRVRVEVNYSTPKDVALVTVRSMYVTDCNADVSRLSWIDAAGQHHNQPIMAFARVRGSEFLFNREVISRHNTSAPDIWIGSFEVAGPGPSTYALTGLAVAAVAALSVGTLRRRR